jgi:peroxiredoxin
MKNFFLMLLALGLALPSAGRASMKAPDFSGTDIQGAPQSLAQYQGKPLVLYFWATWCPACRRDVKEVSKVYTDYKDKIGFVSVSLDEDLNKLKEYVASEGLAFPVLFDGKGWKNDIVHAYEVNATPTYALISPDGNLMGKGSWSKDLRQTLDRISGKPAAEIKVPEFSGTDLNGVAHDLSKYEGRPLVLYFWATWCPACRKDIGDINKLFKKFQPKGIEFLSVSLDTEKEKVQEYVAEHKLGFPVLFEGKAWDNENARRYGVNATPSFFLISADQRAMTTGSWHDELEKAIKSL